MIKHHTYIIRVIPLFISFKYKNMNKDAMETDDSNVNNNKSKVVEVLISFKTTFDKYWAFSKNARVKFKCSGTNKKIVV